MRTIRNFCQSVRFYIEAQAKWDYQMSKNILSSKKRLLVLLLLTLPVILVTTASAAGLLPEKIPILGGSKAFMPSYINNTMFFGSILVGLIAGLITGVIGAGGGYVLTPALMSFGVRGIMAVGTDQFHLFAKAIMGTTIHKKLGNVNFGLAAWFVVGSLVGVTCGGNINRAIFQYNPALSDALINTVYVVVLGILGFYAIGDWKKLRQSQMVNRGGSEAAATTKFAVALQKLPAPPYVRFDQNVVAGGRKISIYPVIICGFIVGFVAAIMGVGGGFLTFPMFVYGLGVSTFTTVGTDILQIIFTTCYSSIFQYAIYGFVFYTVSIGMLLGSLVGVQIGAMVTKIVKGALIRVFYALTILAGFVNRLCALPRKLADLGYISFSREATVFIEKIGTIIFFAIVGFFALWIIEVFFVNLDRIRSGADRGAGPGRLVVNPGKFKLGVASLVMFMIVLGMGFLPIINNRNTLVWADNLFNQLAKGSANYLADGMKKADQFRGQIIDIGIHPREFADEAKLTRVVAANQLKAYAIGDGRVKIVGDLGVLSKAAVTDAKLAFMNQNEQLERRYGLKSEEVIYCWWVVFDGLTRRYIQENKTGAAEFTKFMTMKVLEPSYNFRGIRERRLNEVQIPVALLLGFYLLYTVWYGFSIMFLFEGLGITMGGGAKKLEA